MVPVASLIGTSVASEGCGGRWTTPSSFADPTKPNFHSSERLAADADGRAGSGRRGGSTGRTPRQRR